VGRRILLVNDDIAEISAVKRVVTKGGDQPVLATNSTDALTALGQGRPDLVIIGSTCEGGYALSITHRLQDDPTTSDVPMIVIGQTDAASPAAVQIARPIDPEQLGEQVKALLSRVPLAPPAAPAPRPAPRAGSRAGPPALRPAGANARPAAAPPPAADPGAAQRRAAADALRARANELRKGPQRQAAPAAAPPRAPAAGIELRIDGEGESDGGLQDVLRRAEQLEKAHAAERSARTRQEDRAKVEAAQRAEAERLAVEKARRADAEARRAREESRRASEAEAKAELGERARAEAEAKGEAEAVRRAAEARRAQSAEQKAKAEANARKRLEGELETLRSQLENERSKHEEEIQTVITRAAAEERANEEIRRMAEEEAEEELRAAIESARAEMEALRRKTEDEARRRTQAESELARLTADADRLAEARAALANPLPDPSPEEETLRSRIQALRAERGGDGRRPATGQYEPPSWLEPAAPRRATPASPGAAPAPPDELRAGDLAAFPVPRLLAAAARARVGGRIDFEGETARSIYFDGGKVVGASSAAPTERVEELAVRLGLVTRDQYRQVVSAASTLPTRRAAVLLLERGFLKPTELTALVRRRTEEVVFGVFAETEGRFRWTAAEVPPDERIALERETLSLAVEGVRRRWLADRVEAVLGGAATLIGPAASPPPPEALGLSPEEQRAVALADGLRTLDEIVAASPLDPLTTRQVLAGLVLVGALAVRVHHAGRPSSAAAAAIDLGRVREKLDQVRRADYFTILGVGRMCTPHEVREAADRLLAEFDPGRFAGFREDGLPEKLDEILRVVDDAREVLADGRLREAYLHGLGG
jgi:CheY-like chemotaxis protein